MLDQIFESLPIILLVLLFIFILSCVYIKTRCNNNHLIKFYDINNQTI
jgi:hypothetical protein